MELGPGAVVSVPLTVSAPLPAGLRNMRSKLSFQRFQVVTAMGDGLITQNLGSVSQNPLGWC